MTRSGEFDWIATYLAPLAAENSFGLKDDAALLQVPDGKSLIVTQDAIAEGIHFLPDDPLDLVARKALRVNISDIIAKGAVPHSYSLALGVPDSWKDSDMKLLAQGLAADHALFGLELTGGDTYRSPDRLCVTVTMFAMIDQAAYRSRLGAKPGDLIFVTGTIGDAALGLQIATGAAGSDDYLLNAYRLPNPPLQAAEAIAEFATASMDISDGLVGDCRKLCVASNVAGTISRNRIPLSDAAQALVLQDPDQWRKVLAGGDDYQILCTVNPAQAEAFRHAVEAKSVRVSQIGEINASNKVGVALDIDGVEVSIEEDSYSHF